MKSLTLFLLFFLVSCASYVNSVHRQIDREEKVGVKKGSPRDRFSAYREKDRFRRDGDKRPIQNPITYSLGSNPAGVQPPVKRQYRPQRYQADDFVDNDSNGSLWANQGSSASLFTYQNDKRMGDIVIINVLENLRNQISAELKRTFPDKPKKKKKGDTKEGEKKAAQAPPPAAPNNNQDNEMDMKVYDKISGTVMEEISKDYILLRGRKEVIFKKEKRSIEVQALVSRKDIMENDYVNSDKLLESRVFILGRDR
ncbi:MAG: flagellar basal body L-ring protein FlgH [Bacteriovoracia bacterium]